VEIAIAILAFGCVFLLVLGLKLTLQTGAGQKRLSQLGSPTAALPTSERESLVRGGEKGLTGLLHRIGERREGGDLAGLRSRMLHAGFRKPSASAVYYGFRLSLALGLPPLVALLPIVWSLPAYQQIGLLCLVAAIGYIAPSIYLSNRVTNRQGAITRTLPDALDLMVVCVEAGFGINQSLGQVAEEFRSKSPILAEEFSLVVQQTRAGKTSTGALRELADRTGVSDISSLVALLVQTERFGTSVANALRVHAEAMRIMRMQRAEERAQMATLKLILPSTMIFGALLLIFLAPGMYRLMGAFGSQ
jgi:tight adherence protein C